MARSNGSSVPEGVYRLFTGAALVAGLSDQPPVKLHEWRRKYPSPHSKPDFMINVAGMPVEAAQYERCAWAFRNIGEDRQQTLLTIFEQAGQTTNPRAFIRDALFTPENLDLSRALTQEGVFDDENFLKTDFEYFVLHQAHPEFFAQVPVKRNGARPANYSSEAGRAFHNAIVRQRQPGESLPADQCTPWAVLAAAGKIQPTISVEPERIALDI